MKKPRKPISQSDWEIAVEAGTVAFEKAFMECVGDEHPERLFASLMGCTLKLGEMFRVLVAMEIPERIPARRVALEADAVFMLRLGMTGQLDETSSQIFGTHILRPLKVARPKKRRPPMPAETHRAATKRQ
jgi:hypothetical protein